MINKVKNKRLEITLSKEDVTLLDSLSNRFNISKSETIRQALKIFAAKRKHIITLYYKESTEKGTQEEVNQITQEEDKNWDKMLDELDKSSPQVGTSPNQGTTDK